MTVTPETLRALRDKYSEISRLRRAHAAGEGKAPRAVLLALARRFPGALRELDLLPMETIDARCVALSASIEHGHPLPAWAPLQISYHGVMRAALRIKHRFARRTDAADVLAELPHYYAAEGDEPALESLDLAVIEAILRPPAGRLNPWAYARVASEHGVDPSQVSEAFFPAKGA